MHQSIELRISKSQSLIAIRMTIGVRDFLKHSEICQVDVSTIHAE